MHCSAFLNSQEARHPRGQGESPTPMQPVLFPMIQSFPTERGIMRQRRATCGLPYTMTYGIGPISADIESPYS